MIWDGWVRGFGRGERVWRRPKKVNLGRKLLETEDEEKSSFEKLRAVLGVLLVVAVRQHIFLLKSKQKTLSLVSKKLSDSTTVSKRLSRSFAGAQITATLTAT